MDKKTTGIIATVVTALLCGCPGLAAVCWGALAAIASFVPGADIDIMGSRDPQSALTTGLGALCLGIVFIAIPVVVGFVTLRKKPDETPVIDEPLPPAV
ncbi:MAG: hypothetical protein PHS96_02975 [Anaerolineales bacterium]|nr:hypothetical protein [Anaerolineales bacterium]MDD5466749.1 hypothetical protein [Anaerolineales bacterium]